MSADKKPVLRSGGKNTVEDFNLPKWDRQGNLVKKPVKNKPVAKTKVEDVKQETVKVPTAKDVEAIREEAYNEGFEQGYQNGLAQGKREGIASGHKEGLEKGQQEGLESGTKKGLEDALAEERTKTDEKLAVLQEMSSVLKSQLSNEQAELQEALTALAIRIAKQTLQDELRLKPSHIANVVHAAIQCLPNPDEKLTLLLNPTEVDFVETFAESQWQLQADESISVGGCKVKSGYSYVDYTLEHRFDNAVSHLLTTIPDIDADKVKQPLSDEFLMHSHVSDEASTTQVETEKEKTDLETENENEEQNSEETTAENALNPSEETLNEIEAGSEPTSEQENNESEIEIIDRVIESQPEPDLNEQAPDDTQPDSNLGQPSNADVDSVSTTETQINESPETETQTENLTEPQIETPDNLEEERHEPNPSE